MLKDIPGFEGYYQASEDGQIFSHHSNRFLNSPKNGYKTHRLIKEGKTTVIRTHRLVAITFLPNPLNKTDVNHKNGIKTDNRVENLEWATRSENIKHSFDILGRPRLKAEQCPKSKLVLDLITGVYYPSVGEYATAKGLNRHTAKSYCRKGINGVMYA